jgi:hypothetical protein
MTKAKNIDISERQKSILLGTLLGDGSLGIYTGYRNALFQMRHSIVQTDWFHWKAKELSTLATDKAIHVQKPDGYSTKPKLHFKTRALPSLTALYNSLYANGKNFKSSWLEDLNALSLMVWWLDDGSKIGEGGRKGRLNTQGFGYENNLILRRYFKRRWDISCAVASYIQEGTTYYYLYFQPNDFKKYLRIIMPYIPVSSMVYKAFLRYNDRALQERWISEMKAAMPQFVETIDALLIGKLEDSFDLE